LDLSATILAITSPPGRSSRGMVRISGAQAFELLNHHLEAASDEPPVAEFHAPTNAGEKDADRNPCSTQLPRGPHRATLALLASRRFSVSAFVFPAPRSYTGEDTVELQLPGNPTLLERVIDALIESGNSRGLHARRAEPGEFTARAFFNGRLSLTQAEGVAATIAAQSDAQLRAAQHLTSNRLGAIAHDLAEALANSLALVEAGIDFTDQEDVIAIAPGELLNRLRSLRERIRSQLDRAVGAEQLQAIPRVVLVGEPNAGKSALFNALLGHDRTVVSPTAGTTRDVIAEPLPIETDHGRAEVMLVDLAGLDNSDPSTMNQLMQSAARQAMARAELILRCVPVDLPCTSSVNANELLVRTKCDLLPLAPGSAGGPARQSSEESIHVSGHTTHGLEKLRTAIAQRLSDRAISLSADALALQPRHEAALRSALQYIINAIDLVEPDEHARTMNDPELIASAMRSALDDLADLAGDITPDDILGRVFATFCIGK
jgi:tRNA modification GTPase